jgi:hypothetical protein
VVIDTGRTVAAVAREIGVGEQLLGRLVHAERAGTDGGAEAPLDAFSALRKGRVFDEALMRNVLDREYVALIYAYKHEGFADEREKRLIVVRPPIDGFTSERESRYGPATKTLLAAVEESEFDRYTVGRPGPLPILSIRLAPRNPEEDEIRVRELLDATGYVDVRITRSTTPVR